MSMETTRICERDLINRLAMLESTQRILWDFLMDVTDEYRLIPEGMHLDQFRRHTELCDLIRSEIQHLLEDVQAESVEVSPSIPDFSGWAVSSPKA
jgi:hypothetical protein